ncbi:uncharacterized protein BX663DRAFT_426006 [Cokeromyces recurvatus]|uniref:uncharacterized protein n=1 Tax=Cokeromyces recurvatus TaxID=90255 RepID=UPI002220C4EA|nr:uncharacterized protein BX663DRAFT_426006 [Cokeromyces recurvatus]KAI7908092.1 hypothetical protein BX663DRAFT_426006 [Cokeromyces recurvatus]
MEKNKSQKETLSNENTSKAERNFINIHVNQETNNDTITNYNEASLSIASCSLIQIQSNIKLYRRMALKTQNEDIQMTYAKYLLQIAKLYNKQGKTPEQTRHRLLSEAAYWIVRLAKAKKPEALFIKGRWCLLGPEAEECVIRGYEKTQENKAFKCFLSASKGGWTEAHYELAQLWKIRGKFAKAIQYYEKGAKENHTLSIYKMAKILLRGQLKHKVDIPRGMAYLKQAADMNDFASAEPAFVLGCIYAHEFDCIVNYPLALTYLKKSCQKGYPDALYFMGQILETGKLGQLSDSWQAYQYYVKAADADHVGAMLDLSRIYSQGIPGLLAAQKEIAFKWCSKAADLGFDQAEYVLG